MSLKLAFIDEALVAGLLWALEQLFCVGFHMFLHLDLVHKYFVTALFRAGDFQFLDLSGDEYLRRSVDNSLAWFNS